MKPGNETPHVKPKSCGCGDPGCVSLTPCELTRALKALAAVSIDAGGGSASTRPGNALASEGPQLEDGTWSIRDKTFESSPPGTIVAYLFIETVGGTTIERMAAATAALPLAKADAPYKFAYMGTEGFAKSPGASESETDIDFAEWACGKFSLSSPSKIKWFKMSCTTSSGEMTCP